MIFNEERVKKAAKRINRHFQDASIDLDDLESVDIAELLTDMIDEFKCVCDERDEAKHSCDSASEQEDITDIDGTIPLVLDLYEALKETGDTTLLLRAAQFLRRNGEWVV